ncbi:methylmalonyl CoA epimerase [Capsaspora owczarzaki ATCC 30864]|uniref:Methylmalonyl-CoA epimerase, mitochondrial n=1 Tax=Capsaspora owczarzaki (strain ATCC 30864) TaxID=595528 RepID=A0A0D2WW08_CAPO3|nr:methylmalonyl CoA epimerase [Capsaspora owczarzaki ATCC 30864]KJE96568.1 methylmalonyl CoA epimerase [Capsaspora owczarzaki ATCC 30864]|eukprot:XP_004344491.1 methylmalonyl CoA epimerase [Capsaspora owczarzaki ATCC 30864]
MFAAAARVAVRALSTAAPIAAPASAAAASAAPASVWKLGKLNHVAIAVPKAEPARAFYRDVLQAKVSDIQPQPEHGVYTVFVELGDTKIELLEPYGKDSPIQNFLDKKPDGGLHHICIEVTDIRKAMADLAARKIRALSKEPKIGAHGKPVVFLHPKDCNGVLVELEQA